VVSFLAIESQLPTNLGPDLSCDQFYLLLICKAIVLGRCSKSLSIRSPGILNHARWLTTANRILRLYVSSAEPSENLVVLANFIVKVYAPAWFCIKKNSSCTDGAKNLFQTIVLSRYLPANLLAVIDPVIQRNGYFGHSECLLLAMLADSCEVVRQKAVEIIKQVLNRPSSW
jgi:hypothetical protein